MKRLIAAALFLCMVLTGCGWLDGNYHSVTPHRQSPGEDELPVEVVGNYLQLRAALANMVDSGIESHVIAVADFQEEKLRENMDLAMRYIKNNHPIGAYAVDQITYEVGTVGGAMGISVEITYRHERSEIQRIQRVQGMEEAGSLIENALTQFAPGLVLLVEDYQDVDIFQFVEEFAAENPSTVMETPEVTEQLYPDSGRERVWVLKFSYQTGREALRGMQTLVERIFDSAALYVTQDARDAQKLSQLYAFLMERFDEYQLKTSITPAYSLLNHGVGDSFAFAAVFAEMCVRADVECRIIVGSREGIPWCWNLVLEDGYYYHVDLLACHELGRYTPRTDDQMDSYVWDYSSHPESVGPPVEQEPGQTVPVPGETTPGETAPDVTVPEETLPDQTDPKEPEGTLPEETIPAQTEENTQPTVSETSETENKS